MNSRWELNENVDLEAKQQITSELNLPDVVAHILVKRGISNPQKIREFFKSGPEQLHDPFLLKGMDQAVDRIIEALTEKQRIFIYGDYDVDGITSVALLYLFLKDMGGVVRYYIPDRQNEGYGISLAGVEEAIKWKANLIISVDCGVTSVEEVKAAKEAGIDIIISDHHEPGEILPGALAVIDPKRPDCNYPFPELAGVGVAYKLAQGVSTSWGLKPETHERYIELVAIGSAADIVPLIDENRVFVQLGLLKLNADGGVGISALIKVAGLKKTCISVGQIVYGLAPRINAVGRLGSAEIAVELLTTQDQSEAHRIALTLEEENRRRKYIDSKTLEEAKVKISDEFNPDTDRAIVLAKQDWHAGVIGIVASRIIENCYRPTVMITIEEGVGKGSARSIPGFDIHSALRECSDLLLQFGGHKYAAGLTIVENNIPEFTRRFKEVAAKMISDDDLIPKYEIDADISLEQITPDLIKYLDYFAPFGPKNPKPLFVSHDLNVVYPKLVGSHCQHLRFRVRQEGHEFDAIAFNLGDKYPLLAKKGGRLDLIYHIERNEWMNRVNTQLQVKDLK